MKTKKLNKKLVLNKTTVVDLDGGQMNKVRGGTATRPCNTSDAEPCDCNTSRADPCHCPTFVIHCNSSDAEPCRCF